MSILVVMLVAVIIGLVGAYYFQSFTAVRPDTGYKPPAITTPVVTQQPSK